MRTEPTSVTAPQFSAALWVRLESLIEQMSGCCVKVGRYSRFELRIDSFTGKVYTLEKVLNLKKDPTTGISFLDESMKVHFFGVHLVLWSNVPFRLLRISQARYSGPPWQDRWKSVLVTLPKVRLLSKIDAVLTIADSTFLQQTLGSGYLKLLRLFHEFFASIALHTDTLYTQSHQS